jgi:hypothetical protein
MGLSGQRHAPAALQPRGNDTRQQLYWGGWAPELVWTQGVQEKSFRLCRGSNLDRPVVQSVARLTELHGSPLEFLPKQNNNPNQIGGFLIQPINVAVAPSLFRVEAILN